MEDRRIPVEDLIAFPTAFSFKAVGHHTWEFAASTLYATRKVLGDDRPIDLRSRLSRQAAYVSVTLTTRIDNVGELHAVYTQLRQTEGVITVL